MDVLLIKPFTSMPTSFAPLGLAYLGSALEAAGHKVKIWDLRVQDISLTSLADRLLPDVPDVIGLTCMITEFPQYAKTAAACRAAVPSVPIIVGGPLPTSRPDIFFAGNLADIVAMGEGEQTIVEIVSKLDSGDALDGVAGIAYKKDGKWTVNSQRPACQDLDAIPFPARHLLPMEQYFSTFDTWFAKRVGITATNIVSSRGCPYHCVYCDKSVSGTRWRGRSAANLVNEMESLVNTYGVNGFVFNDDMFDFNRKRVYDICDEIEKRGLNVVWAVNSRINHAHEEMYRRMFQAGCRAVAFGIESGSQEILDRMNKKITLDKVVAGIDKARLAGLRTVGYFMIGMIGETRETIERTIKFAKMLPLDSGGFSKVVPLPQTRLYDMAQSGQAIQDEKELVTTNPFEGKISLVPDLDSSQLNKLVEKAYWQFFWSRPSRNLPRPVTWLIGNLFPAVYGVLMGRMNAFLYINNLRKMLKLPLP